MRLACLAGAAFAACTSAASAQTADPYGNWGGVYVGTGFGYQDSEMRLPGGEQSLSFDDTNTPGVDYASPAVTPKAGDGSFNGHALLGYRRQKDRLLFGVEGDFTMAGRTEFDSSYQGFGLGCPVTPLPGGSTGCVHQEIYGDFESLGHLRATAGIVITPSLMGFAAAGLAFGEGNLGGVYSHGVVNAPPSTPLSGNANKGLDYRRQAMGFSLGGGLEFKAAHNIIVRGEYIHDDYGAGGNFEDYQLTFTGTLGNTTTLGPLSTGTTTAFTNNTVRMSLIYRTNDPRDAADNTPVAISGEDGAGNWSGFYAGGGASASGTSFSLPDYLSASTVSGITSSRSGFNDKDDTLSGHIVAGYRHAFGRFIFGVEGDAVLGDRTKFGTHDLATEGCFAVYISSGRYGCGESDAFGSFENLGHVRGTAGFEITPTLMGFVSGGVAFGRADFGGITASASSFSSPNTYVFERDTTTAIAKQDDLTGLSLGGGIEMKISKHITMRGEYVYDRYEMDIPDGTASLSIGGGTPVDVTVSSGGSAEYETRTGRVSLLVNF